MLMKKIDDLGRIAIPKPLRDGMGWQANELVELEQVGGTLVLKKHCEIPLDYDNKLRQIINALPDLPNFVLTDNQGGMVAAAGDSALCANTLDLPFGYKFLCSDAAGGRRLQAILKGFYEQ